LMVVDPDGALIPNAEIMLESKSGKEKLSGLSGSSGEWSAGKVAPGNYQLTVKSRGFRTFVGNVSVQESKLLGLKIRLPIAELKEAVEISGSQDVVMVTTVGVLATTHSSTIPISASGGQRAPMR